STSWRRSTGCAHGAWNCLDASCWRYWARRCRKRRAERAAPSPRLLGRFLFLTLAVDAVASVRERVQPIEAHVRAARMAGAERLRVVVQPPEGLLEPIEVPALLGRERRGLLPLHGLCALIGHVIGVCGQIRIARVPIGL